MRATLPPHGSDWPSLEARMREYASRDVDWRSGRAAVYVFHAGEDVLRVARDAYALFQSENALGPLAFPSLRRMEEEVVGMGLDLLHAPEGACGNLTSGGSESIFLAVKTCRDAARARGSDADLIVLPRSAHPAFDKAAHYLGLRVVRVPVGPDLRADVAAMAREASRQTLLLVGSAPCFPYGVIDPIEALAALAREREVWLHVDACVGGYFAPFARMNGVPVPPFDFEVEGVRSISADLHKYGYAAKGASTLFHRDAAQHAHQIFSFDDWPSGGMTTPTAAGTRPGGAIASAWAVMHYLGVEGYRARARLVTDTRERLAAALETRGFRVLGAPLLGLLACSSDAVDVFAVWGELARRGWMSALCTEPRALHWMLSPAHAQVLPAYLADLDAALAQVRAGASGPDVRARYA